ncbi:MAG: GNAT family N-acetyltransferase [Bacteroidetes bacterium]|nr:GNAT family N-acetyltransferase [Bacteroidota bacterium]
MANTILETTRLQLKPITPAIIHELFGTRSDEEIMAFFGIEKNGLVRYREMHEKGMETDRISLYAFLLIDKATHTPVGECGFHTLNLTHRRTELFYLLRDDQYKKKGLMSEALPRVLQFGFEALNLHRIEALVDSANTPSVKLLLKNGFTKEGTMREDYCVNGVNEDSDCYSLLKWEWEKNQQR